MGVPGRGVFHAFYKESRLSVNWFSSGKKGIGGD
jgi:hypothetical protein